MIQILLVDDQPAVRQGWRMCLALEPDIAVIGEASNGREAIALALKLQPEVILLDVEMPLMDGMTAARELHAALPACAIIMTSIHDNATSRAHAQAAGAAAFVGKQESIATLLATIRRFVSNVS